MSFDPFGGGDGGGSSSWAGAVPTAATAAAPSDEPAPAAPAALAPQPVMAVERDVLLRAVKRQRARATYCWTLPLAVLSYAFFCASLVLHVQIDRAHEFESGLVRTVLGPDEDGSAGGPRVGSIDGVYDYLGGSLLPTLFADDPAARGRVNTYGVLLGGVRLAQGRSGAGACPFGAAFPKLAAARVCYPEGTESTADFGTDAAAAAAANVSSAFTRTATVIEDAAKADTLDPFELLLPAALAPATARARLEGLRAGGWIDAASKHVHVETGVLNFEIMAWARVLLTFSFTRGGRVDAVVTVRSLPIDPYLERPWLWFFDILNLAYLLVTGGLLCANVVRVARRVWRLRADGFGLGSFLAVFDAWLVIDWGATLCYLATAVTWGQVVLGLHRLQAVAGDRAWDGSDGPAALAADVSRVHGYLGDALERYWEAKTAACATLFFLTLRLFWQFSLQPKLAVMTECLSRGASDMLHFGVLFAVIMASYTVWGHVAFGSQAHDWRSLSDAAFAVIRFSMYDYDLVNMTRADARAASLFFGSFMFFITNMILWMFLAIIIDFYSEVRAETRGSPSALADLATATKELPSRLRAVGSRLQEVAAAGGGGGGGSSGGGGGGGLAHWLGAALRALGLGRPQGQSLDDGDGPPPVAPVGGAILGPLGSRISLGALEELLTRPPLLGKVLVTADELAGPLVAAPEDVANVLAQLAPFAGVVMLAAGGGGPPAGGTGGGAEGGAPAPAESCAGGARGGPLASPPSAAGALSGSSGAPSTASQHPVAAPGGGPSSQVMFTARQRAAASVAFATAKSRARDRTGSSGADGGAPAVDAAAGNSIDGVQPSRASALPEVHRATASAAVGGSQRLETTSVAGSGPGRPVAASGGQHVSVSAGISSSDSGSGGGGGSGSLFGRLRPPAAMAPPASPGRAPSAAVASPRRQVLEAPPILDDEWRDA